VKCISLWQPWASAVALGLKKIETRGYQTRLRGRFAIQAAKYWAPSVRRFAQREQQAGRLPLDLPLGAIVCTAVLVDVVPTTRLVASSMDPVERLYGNYDEGRYGWILEDVVALPQPIPFSGKQGFFNVPDELFTGLLP
jgi:hypothetical protein